MADYLLFAGAFLASAIAPGADTFLILSRAISNRRLAIAAAAGITTGKVLMVSLAYLGLAALLASNSELFLLIKVFGAAFLVYKAIKLWSAKRVETKQRQGSEFFAALAIGISNPQPLAFYLAIVPVVVGTTQLPILILIVVLGFSVVSAFYIFLAARLAKWLALESRFQQVNRVLAIAFLVLAVIVLTR
ncbi:MAG: hypothetical protein RL537_1067 [Actinomycetota bacterium]